MDLINGDHIRLERNHVSNGIFGVWACDHNGLSIRNTFTGNLYGLILCKVPPNSFPMPSGTIAGSENSATRWISIFDTANDNISTGFLVIDGATRNRIFQPTATGNGEVPIELAGETERFGFTSPTSSYNKVLTWQTPVKDCGFENSVVTFYPIGADESPCY